LGARDTETGGPGYTASKKMQISTNSYKLFNKKKSNDSFLSCTLHHQSSAGAQNAARWRKMKNEKRTKRPKRQLEKL